MKQFQLFAFVFILITSCSTTSSNDKLQKTGKKYFEYDQIDHYFNNFDERKLPEVANKYGTKEDTIRATVLWGKVPTSLMDTNFVKNLDGSEYKKRILNQSLYTIIDEIFAEKEVVNQAPVSACVHFYRDVLVFKKNNKIIGIAKVCFGCGANQIVGTSLNTYSFGGDGDYEKLEKLLR